MSCPAAIQMTQRGDREAPPLRGVPFVPEAGAFSEEDGGRLVFISQLQFYHARGARLILRAFGSDEPVQTAS
jgi:hypothetical protein